MRESLGYVPRMRRLGVLASGSGTILQAILDAALPVAVVVVDRSCAAIGRAEYTTAHDAEVLEAFKLLSQTEGIIPALESAHAVAWVARTAGTDALPTGSTVLITLSGRGDKDVAQVRDILRSGADA